MASTYLMTGATAGFGGAMTRRFVRDGHHVIAAARRADRLREFRNEIGSAVLSLTLDGTDGSAGDASGNSASRGRDDLLGRLGMAPCAATV